MIYFIIVFILSNILSSVYYVLGWNLITEKIFKNSIFVHVYFNN